MSKRSKACQLNSRFARNIWGELPRVALRSLDELTKRHSLSIASGDLLFLEGKWYVTHSGLLQLARRNHCAGIGVRLVHRFCDSNTARWAFKATVYKSPNCKGFVGYGDADPSNTSPLVRGAEMRVAETRAVNRVCARPMASASARLRSWVGWLGRVAPAKRRQEKTNPRARTARATANLASATASAC